MTLQEWLQESIDRFQNADVRRDTETLLFHALNISRAFFYTHPETIIPPDKLLLLESLLTRCLSGEPIAYILGEKEFWSMSFKVSPDVLIPRPETEHLIDIVLNYFDEKQPQTILELGTGSGAIAIALAKERPHWKIIAIDVSQSALVIAQENAKRLLSSQTQTSLSFYQSHWFQNLPSHFQHTFSAIISNPPYIAENDPHLPSLAYEPLGALVSGLDGLQDIREIITQSSLYLKPNGLLLLEHGFEQANAVSAFFHEAHFKGIQTWKDWAEHDRITGGVFRLNHSKVK